MRALGLVLALAVAGLGCYSSTTMGMAGAGGAGGMAGAVAEGGASGEGGVGGGGGATAACTNPADLTFLCGEDSDLNRTLTACGHCAFFGLLCPTGCDGEPIAPYTSAALCAVATLGDQACDPGLSHECLDCYLKVSQCGTLGCSQLCSEDPGGCLCLDCVYDNCSVEFEACTGFGVPSSTTPGGPPACEAQPSCNPPDPT